MDFFLSHDWLNREATSYAFKLDHILFIVIGLLIGVGLCFFLRKKEKRTITIVITSIWALAVLVELIYYGFTYALCISDPVTYPFDIESMLPFHSCLMFLYIFPVAIFFKNKLIKRILTCSPPLNVLKLLYSISESVFNRFNSFIISQS